MPRRTAIHAGHVIAFDGRGHRLLRDGTVILDGDRIVAVGRRTAAPAETVSETIDAPDAVLTPGLISTHAISVVGASTAPSDASPGRTAPAGLARTTTTPTRSVPALGVVSDSRH